MGETAGGTSRTRLKCQIERRLCEAGEPAEVLIPGASTAARRRLLAHKRGLLWEVGGRAWMARFWVNGEGNLVRLFQPVI